MQLQVQSQFYLNLSNQTLKHADLFQLYNNFNYILPDLSDVIDDVGVACP